MSLRDKILKESWTAKDGRVMQDGFPVGSYEFDRDADCFWVDDPKGTGQIAFETKEELIRHFKNPKHQNPDWVHSKNKFKKK